MRNASQKLLHKRETIIKQAMLSLVPDLLQIQPSDYAAFLQFGLLPEVYSFVDHTLKQHYPDNNLQFSCTGQVTLDWVDVPTVALDFEFESQEVSLFFRLIFSIAMSCVSLHHISFQNSETDPTENNFILSEALEPMRLAKTACYRKR